VLRTPHFLIPLYLLLLWREPGQVESKAKQYDLFLKPIAES
jgi:hypothetical protein